MTTLVVIVGGLAAVAAGLLYLAHLDAKLEMAKARYTREAPKQRVRRAWTAFVQEHGRPPSTLELLDRLYPETEEGGDPEAHGLPPSYALYEMGYTNIGIQIEDAIRQLNDWRSARG